MITEEWIAKHRAMFEDVPSNPYITPDCVRIKPGDWYWAQRNGPPRILQCSHANDDIGCYHSVQSAYSYDYNEYYAAKPGVDLQTIQQASEVLTQAMQDWRPTYDWRQQMRINGITS